MGWYRVLLGCYRSLLGCESYCEIEQKRLDNGESLTRRKLRDRTERWSLEAAAVGRDDAPT